MLCLLFDGYRAYHYYIDCDLVIILVRYHCLVMCIQYFIVYKYVYIMNFTTAVAADKSIAYLFYVETSQRLFIYLYK